MTRESHDIVQILNSSFDDHCNHISKSSFVILVSSKVFICGSLLQMCSKLGRFQRPWDSTRSESHSVQRSPAEAKQASAKRCTAAVAFSFSASDESTFRPGLLLKSVAMHSSWHSRYDTVDEDWKASDIYEAQRTRAM